MDADRALDLAHMACTQAEVLLYRYNPTDPYPSRQSFASIAARHGQQRPLRKSMADLFQGNDQGLRINSAGLELLSAHVVPLWCSPQMRHDPAQTVATGHHQMLPVTTLDERL